LKSGRTAGQLSLYVQILLHRFYAIQFSLCLSERFRTSFLDILRYVGGDELRADSHSRVFISKRWYYVVQAVLLEDAYVDTNGLDRFLKDELSMEPVVFLPRQTVTATTSPPGQDGAHLYADNER